MQFLPTPIQGVFIIELELLEDKRGFFARSWCIEEFKRQGLESNIVQCNLSYNISKGTVRGLHYQKYPYEEVKIVRCIKGKIFDVAVDLRKDSPTFLKWIGIELTEKNYRALYIPKGMAHGFQTLEDESLLMYQVSQCYTPGAEAGIRWDDPKIAINWPIKGDRVLSDKDAAWPLMEI